MMASFEIETSRPDLTEDFQLPKLEAGLGHSNEFFFET